MIQLFLSKKNYNCKIIENGKLLSIIIKNKNPVKNGKNIDKENFSY